MKYGYMIGAELNEEMCRISYYDEKVQRPQVLDEIPFVIGHDEEQWFFGEEAQKLEGKGKAFCVTDPLKYALNQEPVKLGEEIYEAQWLVSLFFQCVLKEFEPVDSIVFSVPEMDKKILYILKNTGEAVGVSKENIYVQDHKESFCNYMICQPRELWQNESVLFFCNSDEISAYVLRKIQERNGRRRDVFITVEEAGKIQIENLQSVYSILDTDEARAADEKFAGFVKKVFAGKFISSVFLSGSIFEFNWYPEAVRYLCDGKRAFQGNTLYSEGACYTSCLRKQDNNNYPVYWDDSKLKERICLQFRVNGMDEWYPVVSWGTRWYEQDKQFEILLEDDKDIEVRVESLGKKEADIIKVCLDGLPKRNDYTIRLQVNITFYDENTCRIEWKDLGFGAFYEPSEFQADTLIHLGGNNGEFNFMS